MKAKDKKKKFKSLRTQGEQIIITFNDGKEISYSWDDIPPDMKDLI